MNSINWSKPFFASSSHYPILQIHCYLHRPMKLPVILAFVWLVLKVVMLQMNVAEEKYGVMLNLLFIVIVIFVAIRDLKGERDFVTLIKAAMRPAALYVVCACVAIFIYYQWLDPGYLPGAMERVIVIEQGLIDSAGGYEAYRDANVQVKAASESEHLQIIRDSFGGFISLFSPYGRASIALLTLTFFAVFYSLFMVSILLLAHRYLKK